MKPKPEGIQATARAAASMAQHVSAIDASVSRLIKSLEPIQAIASSAERLVGTAIDPKVLEGLQPDIKVRFAHTEALDKLIGGVAASSWRG